MASLKSAHKAHDEAGTGGIVFRGMADPVCSTQRIVGRAGFFVTFVDSAHLPGRKPTSGTARGEHRRQSSDYPEAAGLLLV